MKLHTKSALLLIVLVCTSLQIRAQEVKQDFQSRTYFELKFKPLDKLKFNLTPEVRFDENFSVDEYVFEGEALYKPIKILTLGATYRFQVNPRDTKETEYLNRYALSATVNKKINRFTPTFRLRYSNYADDEVNGKEYLRYKAKIVYDIKNLKLTPFVAAEAFQQMQDASFHKMRYSTGLKYKLNKHNAIGLSYKLDYYMQAYRNRHIVSLGYAYKF